MLLSSSPPFLQHKMKGSSRVLLYFFLSHYTNTTFAIYRFTSVFTRDLPAQPVGKPTAHKPSAHSPQGEDRHCDCVEEGRPFVRHVVTIVTLAVGVTNELFNFLRGQKYTYTKYLTLADCLLDGIKYVLYVEPGTSEHCSYLLLLE